MAHHGSTPASVLNAPSSRPVLISDQSDLSRRERRRAYQYVAKSPTTGLGELRTAIGTKFVPKAQQLPTRNRPYVKAEQAAAAASAPARSGFLSRLLRRGRLS